MKLMDIIFLFSSTSNYILYIKKKTDLFIFVIYILQEKHFSVAVTSTPAKPKERDLCFL
jgi:hypothetical protein